MKRLYLVRHAKSSWGDPYLPDFDRPLNSRGQRDAPRMGACLAAQGHVPRHIVTSPARRAHTTAGLLATAMGVSSTCLIEDRRVYAATASTLLDILKGWDDTWDHVMMVGHNPGISSLASMLQGETVDQVRTCAVLGMLLDTDSWADVVPGCGQLCLAIDPKEVHRA